MKNKTNELKFCYYVLNSINGKFSKVSASNPAEALQIFLKENHYSNNGNFKPNLDTEEFEVIVPDMLWKYKVGSATQPIIKLIED